MPAIAPAPYCPRTGVARTCSSRIGRSALSTLSFSSRTGVLVERRGRLHGDQAEKLQHMVLNHVTQRAGVVVVAASAFDADVLRAR